MGACLYSAKSIMSKNKKQFSRG